jgi:hypothetical protein
MPLPKPKNKEKKSDFIGRCVSEVAKDPKFEDNKQRVAICYTQFDESKSEASIVGEIDGEEFLIFSELKEKERKVGISQAQEIDMNAPEMEQETPEQELQETNKDLYEMAVGSITSIKAHADNILNALNDLKVQENLTETWMQGKLAIAEDYLVTVHNYVMFNKEN